MKKWKELKKEEKEEKKRKKGKRKEKIYIYMYKCYIQSQITRKMPDYFP